MNKISIDLELQRLTDDHCAVLIEVDVAKSCVTAVHCLRDRSIVHAVADLMLIEDHGDAVGTAVPTGTGAVPRPFGINGRRR